MQVAGAAVVLVLLTLGCAHLAPDTPVPWSPHLARSPDVPRPATTAAASAQQEPAPAAPPAPKPATPGTAGRAEVSRPAAETPAATAPLDLTVLEQELRATKAIGVFTKITLKNQIDDLLDEFRDYYRGKAKVTIKDLRRRFDLLLMKVLSLLQDKDQALASAIVASREALWDLLADPKTFATIKG